MTSLGELVATAAPVLVLDAAAAEVQVGRLESDGTLRCATSAREAGTGLYACLGELGVDPAAPGCWVFCEGPGSILGIRTVAIALRTWQALAPRPVYSYRSLELLAVARRDPVTTYIADARRDTWHAQQLAGPLRRVAPQALAGPLALPANFRRWAEPPAGTTAVDYRLETLLPASLHDRILRDCPEPDAYQAEPAAYVTWEPQVHRAP